jgi:hypothetical protein
VEREDAFEFEAKLLEDFLLKCGYLALLLEADEDEEE